MIFNRFSIETMVGTRNSENFSEKSRENDLRVVSSTFYNLIGIKMGIQLLYDTRIEPAGAGGATGASLQLRRHQLGRGGRWRRSRHLRRVQRPRQGGIENGPSRRRVPGGTPFFECTFHEIAIEFCSEPVQKAAEKKWHRQTDKQTDRSGRS